VSHIVTIKTQAKDSQAIAAACQRLGLAAPQHGTARLFEGEATGLLVRLPGWLYPLVIDPASGDIRFDNYAGAWGDPQQLDRFKQAYAIEKTRIEAAKKGHRLTEQKQADGSVKLTITPRS
jgi:hypothetical protein